MKNIFFLSFLLIFSVQSFAQQKQLELQDVYTSAALYPARINSLQWVPNSTEYTYIEGEDMMKVSAKGKSKSFLNLSKVNEDWQKAGFKEQKRFPHLTWSSETQMQFISNDTLYSYIPKTGSIQMLCYYPISSEYIKSNPANSNQVAYTVDNNLLMADGNKVIEVTKDQDKAIVNGQTVSRSEFGIVDGIFWSPKGNLLAYYKKDESKVGEYPLVNTDAREAEVKMIRYPMAGMSSEIVYVMVYNPKTNKSLKLDTKAIDGFYLTNISWSPDEKHIFIQVVNREQNHVWMNQYDVTNGSFVKTLFEDTNDKWVEPEEGIYFLNNSTDQFVFMSERDGFYHAYLYNIEGKLLKQLTKGPWIITSFEGFNADNSKMYFMGTKDSPIERHLYELDMNTLSISKITGTAGTHGINLSDDKTMLIDRYSNANGIAAEYLLVSTDKRKTVKVLQENTDPLKDYAIGEMSINTLKADDGTDLYYRLIKPANFEEGKKYPVIIYVYGGPHAQMVNNTWLGGGGFFLQYLAAKGYVVFTLDNRGSGNRGFAFESGIHRQLGTLEMQDQMKGVEFLRSLNYVDTNRIGVNGWSYGGFMTTSLLLNHADVFKVGVAGGPVIDWKYYEVMYGERYMDTPEENPIGYKNASTLNKVKNLEGQLLIIHGTMDPTVVWQNSQVFVKECVKNQKQLDYFIYPGHEHNVRGIDRLHLELKMSKYFDDFL